MILYEAIREVWRNNIRHLPLSGQITCVLLALASLPVVIPMLGVAVCLMISLRLFSKLSMGRCTCTTRMEGKTVLVTGATSGIGYETALDLARRGARLILAVRNLEKGKAVADKIGQLTGNKDVKIKYVDLSNLKSVRKFSEEILSEETRIDVLINNAGNAAWEKVIDITDEGLEYQMASNYFGHFLMTNLIIDLVKRAAPSRIINVGSMVHWRTQDLDLDDLNFQRGRAGWWKIYGTTKLCMILFAKELARRLRSQGLEICNVCTFPPRHSMRFLLWSFNDGSLVISKILEESIISFIMLIAKEMEYPGGVVANSMHPGVVDTPIYDRQPSYIRYLAWIPRKILFRTPKEGAQTLIHLAVAPEVEHITGEFFAECKPTSWYSRLAGDPVLAKRLWDKSCEIVGLRSDEIKL